MVCDQCGYTLDSFDKECPRCHGAGAKAQQGAPGGAVAFNFNDDFIADDKRLRAKAKQRQIINRIATFITMFMLTQYAASLYNRHAFEQALLEQYNAQLRADGASTSCSRAELRGFGLFGTKTASGYIYCSDGVQRRASWTRDTSGKAEWNIEETGQRE